MWLDIVDIKSSKITSSHRFKEIKEIKGIVAIDDTHYLAVESIELIKFTKDQLIKRYNFATALNCMCQINDSLCLVAT